MLLYALLCGFLPFDDENTFKLYKLIQVCKEAYIHFSVQVYCGWALLNYCNNTIAMNKNKIVRKSSRLR